MANFAYAEKIKELEDIEKYFSENDLDIDLAIQKYEQAQKLASEIEKYLKTAQNKIFQIKQDFEKSIEK